MSIVTAIYITLVAPLLAGALGGLTSQHPDEHTLNAMSGHRRCFAADPLCNFEQAAFFFLQLLVIYQPVSFFKDKSLGGVCTAPGWMGPRSLMKPLSPPAITNYRW